MRPRSTKPMTRIEALGEIAYCLLRTRGQASKPTMQEIVLAVVQASPLLDITINANAASIQLEAANKLIQENKWDIGKVVLLKSSFKKEKPETTTARPDQRAGR